MSEKPILFSAPMVRAILDGRKTQTRRVLKLPTRTHSGGRFYEHPRMGGWEPATHGGAGVFSISRDGERVSVPEAVGLWHRTCGTCIIAPTKVGDRLWVRETWQYAKTAHCLCPQSSAPDPCDQWKAGHGCRSARNKVVYRADARDSDGTRHRPSIHMPRWASRITLEVTGVKIERLQNISADDAVAEGVRSRLPDNGIAQAEYRDLWDTINGPGAWDANPWVAVYTFKVLDMKEAGQ